MSPLRVNFGSGVPKRLGLAVLVVFGFVLFTAGTASAQTPPVPLNDDFAGVGGKHMTCEAAVSEIPGEWDTWDWQNVINTIIPIWDPFRPNPSWYVVLRCAFEDTVRGRMEAESVAIDGMIVRFNGESNIRHIAQCSAANDYWPELDGAEIVLGCTPSLQRVGGVNGSYAEIKAATNSFAKLCEVQFKTSLGYLRSFPTALSAGWLNGVFHEWWYRPIAQLPLEQCRDVTFTTDGMYPPDWAGDNIPDGADLSGCRGLTIRSADIRSEFLEADDEIEMWLAPVDPARDPGPQVVKIRDAYGGYRETGDWSATVTYPPGNFTYVVGPDATKQHEWMFRLQCADGSEKMVHYDPSGEGGAVREDDFGSGPGFNWDQCIAEAAELGVDPSSWVPGLVDRLKCVVEWATTPRRPYEWHMARLSTRLEGTSAGDIRHLATAPSRALGEASAGATSASTLQSSMGPVTLPEPSDDVARRVRLGLSILLGLWFLRVSMRMIESVVGVKTPEAGG